MGTLFGADGNLLAPAEGSNIEAGLKGAFFAGALNMSAAIYRTQKDREPELLVGQLTKWLLDLPKVRTGSPQMVMNWNWRVN